MSAIEKSPVIGKHILSTLTIGMYQDPRMIYREYIQNSADQIDTLSEDELQDKIRQTIVIDIDEKRRRVEIKDSATGIPQEQFQDRLLNVADSQKDPSKNKGFRGIGRLAGLNYCQKLIFESSAPGETSISRLEMDGQEMIRILHDQDDHSLASDVIRRISKISYQDDAEKPYNCWFKVTLEDVRMDVGKQLLDIDSVKEFIAQVAPVPFSHLKFKLGKGIMEEAQKAGVPIEEYTIRVNGVTITKLFKDILCDAHGRTLAVDCKPVYRMIEWHDKKLAWGWFILPAAGVSLPESTNPERKIRLRKGNIQIGFDNFLDPFFPEARSNGYMLGEIYLLSDKILPNGDRNALEVSEEAAAFTDQLRNVFFKDLWAAAHKANELNNARRDIEKYAQTVADYKELASNGATVVMETKKPELEKAYERALAGQQKIERVTGAAIKGAFVKGIVDAFVERRPTSSGNDLITSQQVIKECASKSSKKASKKETVKTTGNKLMNIIIKILSDSGIEPMLALELAQKINENICKEDE